MADKISQAFKAGREMSGEQLTAWYDEWVNAGDYDKTLLDWGYKGPKTLAAYMSKMLADNLISKESRFLDVGSGTGLVGEELSKSGVTNVCALDPSQESLDVCRKKGCYKDYLKCLVGPDKIPVPDNTFDGAFSSGVFLPGHCDGTSLREVVRVVKPGGRILITTRRTFYDDHHDNFNLRQVSDELVASKTCSFNDEDIPNYSQHALGILMIYTVC